jgi:hypothetical protein
MNAIHDSTYSREITNFVCLPLSHFHPPSPSCAWEMTNQNASLKETPPEIRFLLSEKSDRSTKPAEQFPYRPLNFRLHGLAQECEKTEVRRGAAPPGPERAHVHDVPPGYLERNLC